MNDINISRMFRITSSLPNETKTLEEAGVRVDKLELKEGQFSSGIQHRREIIQG